MKGKLFYNNVIFRLTAPALFGILIYLLILMFFDSVNMLVENFFSKEVLFVVGLTYVFFEGNRLVIVLLNRIYPVSKNIRFRLVIQYILCQLLTIAVVSTSLSAYFIYVVGFSTIRTELITFNSIYVFTSLFYNLFFFSMVYLYKRNEAKIQHEKTLRANLETELYSFKNQINPTLLFQSLETIVSEFHRDKKSADNLIDKLSETYRYTLDNKHNELVTLMEEIESLNSVTEIFKVRYENSFELKTNIDPGIYSASLIPGTLQLFVEYALFENIVSGILPLKIIICNVDDTLKIEYSLNRKIGAINPVAEKLQFLEKAYTFYSSDGIKKWENGGIQHFNIPLLRVEEE